MTFATFVAKIINVLNGVVMPLIIALAVLVFIYGVASAYILHPDDQKARASGRQVVLWGVIGLFVIFSIWGIINLMLSTFGIAPTL